MNPLIFNKNIFFYVILIFVTSSSLVFSNDKPSNHNENVLKIGVRAIKGIVAAQKTWTKTIEFLNKNIKNYHFQLVPIVGFHEMKVAVKNKKIDFVLTNPLAYIELNKQSGITRLLTLNKKQSNGVASATFAAVIFTRSDRKDILNLNDIKNKSIMGVHEQAFGGWRMALRELLHHDIDPHRDSSKLLFSKNNTHESVVSSVLSGEVDVGTVRTGVIEKLIKQGKLKRDSITILNAHHDNLDALHSTQHYPEWPFAVLPHIASKISNVVFSTLLNIKPESAAAIAGDYVSWVAPFEYSEVYKLSDELVQQYITFESIWGKHWITILLFLVFVFSILIYTYYLFLINKKLVLSKQELREHHIHLEDVVRMRTNELVIEKANADKANKAKSVFLSNMSHELRTPLNSILGFSQLLDIYEPDNENVNKTSNEIITAGKYLLSLINEILDLAAIESGKTELNLEIVSCREIIKLSLDIVSPLANKKNININLNIISEYNVIADSKRLQQICINLLSNAIKYNQPDGTIYISLDQSTQDLCKFTVKDTGLGIKPEFYDRVFQPFARDKSNADIVEGTGIGLVITKHLIEQMHGEIGFTSEYGNGTEFWVTLPINKVS